MHACSNINTTRHSIPDVPVIYLVEPTAQNLEIITSDLARGLYSPAYVNFLSSIPRPLLEDFAAKTAEHGTAEHLSQIFDQYLNFIVSEPDLFSLGMGKETYWTLNSAQVADEVLDAAVDRIVSGLFSVVVTTGTFAISCVDAIEADCGRHDPYHPLSEGRGCGDDLRQIGSQASGPHSEFQG